MGGFVGSCLPLPACLRAKPPPWLISDATRALWKPGIWAGMGGTDLHEFHVKAHTMILRTTISHEEIKRARSGGAKYFCEKLEETVRRDLKSNLKMVQRDLDV